MDLGQQSPTPYMKTHTTLIEARLKLVLDNIVAAEAWEHFKYQVLTEHLKLKKALLIADSYNKQPVPNLQYYESPHMSFLVSPSRWPWRGPQLWRMYPTSGGDFRASRSFALQIRALVGMLHQLGRQGRT